MSQVTINLFGRNQVSGRDFQTFEEIDDRNVVLSPDGAHMLRIRCNANNQLSILNPANIPWKFTITGFANNDLHVHARLVYQPTKRGFDVNDNYFIGRDGLDNQMITDHDTNQRSEFLNIHFHRANFLNAEMGRVDITIDNGITSSLFFTPTELLFVSLLGDDLEINRWSNRFVDIITNAGR